MTVATGGSREERERRRSYGGGELGVSQRHDIRVQKRKLNEKRNPEPLSRAERLLKRQLSRMWGGNYQGDKLTIEQVHRCIYRNWKIPGRKQ